MRTAIICLLVGLLALVGFPARSVARTRLDRTRAELREHLAVLRANGVQLTMATIPVSPPSVTGPDITVDYYSKNPRVLARSIQDMKQMDFWLSDMLFRQGGSTDSGAVIYFPVTAIDDQFTDGQSDIELVAPGAEFPIVDYTNINPAVALTQKRGAKMKTTKEMKTRNLISRFRSGLQAMYNITYRKSDALAMAVVNAAAIISQAESASWATSTTKIRNDLLIARNTIMNSTLGKTEGYNPDTLVLGSTAWQNITLNQDLMDAYYKAQVQAGNLLNGKSLDGLLGFRRVVMNPFIGANERWVFDATKFGSKISEYPLALETWYDPGTQSDWQQLSESDVYIVEHPKALVKIV